MYIRKGKRKEAKQGQESIIGALAHCKKGVKLERASEISHFCPTISSLSTYHKTIFCSLKEQLTCPNAQKQVLHSTLRRFLTNLRKMKMYASEVENIYFVKS